MALDDPTTGLGLFAFMLAFFVAYFVFIAIIYVYTSLAYMSIAKKLNHPRPWQAWIPIANVFLMAELAENPWYHGFWMLCPIANIVFVIIWTWKIFERRKYHGALSLLPIIPFLGVFAFLIALGFVAWKDQE